MTAFGQTVKACLLGQAAASVMGRNIVGSSARELREVGSAMRRMLKEGGPPPTGKWADLAVLEPVKDYKAPARLDAAGVRCGGGGAGARRRPSRACGRRPGLSRRA